VKIIKPISSLTQLSEKDTEAISLEITDFSQNSNNSCIYIAYIGNSLVKVGFSESISNRNMKHQNSESIYNQFRIIGILEVSGKHMEKLLHEYLLKDKVEYGKQKEIYKPRQTLRNFIIEITTFLCNNDMKMMVQILQKENKQLKLEALELKLKLLEFEKIK